MGKCQWVTASIFPYRKEEERVQKTSLLNSGTVLPPLLLQRVVSVTFMLFNTVIDYRYGSSMTPL